MKKTLAILMCASLVFCASCGKKDDGAKAPEVKQENKVEDAVKELDKKIAENPAEVATDSIEEAKKEAEEIEKGLQEKVGNVPEEEIETFQAQQASVAILQEGLTKLEEAQKAGDEAAIKEAQQLIEMAKSLWTFEDSESE